MNSMGRAWRRGYRLYRRRMRIDRYGDPQFSFDYNHPDAVIADGEESAVCWQDVRTWQSSGQLSSGARQEEYGERERGIVQGVLYGTLELALFDRVETAQGLFEIRAIQHWPNHRLVQLQRVRKEASRVV